MLSMDGITGLSWKNATDDERQILRGKRYGGKVN